ncbi:MAG: prepilin-type N-terminal cleavage/methylation domain-containing protein [Patescibacteria group bacterium]|nr:prepilin-type N-terminal cleavage/methylation domain-containing protein [Patescibacteria group bacterium]
MRRFLAHTAADARGLAPALTSAWVRMRNAAGRTRQEHKNLRLPVSQNSSAPKRAMPKLMPGFSLIEVIVTIAIVGISLTAYDATLYAALAARDAGNQSIALRVAGSELERLRAGGISALSATSTFEDANLSALPGGTGTLATSSYNGTAMEVVSAAVSWQGAQGTRSVSVTTLLAPAGGLP